jgi:uncharacterized membrane protein
MGGLAGHFAEYSICDDFIKKARGQVTKGFLMTQDAVTEKIADRLKGQQFEIISTNMTTEQEPRLREAFSQEEVAAEKIPIRLRKRTLRLIPKRGCPKRTYG